MSTNKHVLVNIAGEEKKAQALLPQASLPPENKPEEVPEETRKADPKRKEKAPKVEKDK